MIQPNPPPTFLSADTVEIKDLDQFIKILARWHANKVNIIRHMHDIPETAEVSIGDGPNIPVTGDFRKGYQLGLSLAMSELGELPFVAEMEESAAVELKH